MNEIITTRLRMQPFTADDGDALAALKRRPENMAGTAVGVLDAKAAAGLITSYVEQWTRGGPGMWALMDLESGRFIGECGFAHRAGMTDLSVRYTLDRDWWGRGLAPEAVAAAVAFGFDKAGLERCGAVALSSNTRSHRILESVGMTVAEEDYEGIPGFRRYQLTRGGLPQPPRGVNRLAGSDIRRP